MFSATREPFSLVTRPAGRSVAIAFDPSTRPPRNLFLPIQLVDEAIIKREKRQQMDRRGERASPVAGRSPVDACTVRQINGQLIFPLEK